MGVTSINGASITASTSTSASVANAVVVQNTTTGTGPYYLTFVSGTSGYNILATDSSTLTYNATSNTITATTFAGTASVADRLLCPVNTSNNATNYIPFTPSYNAGGVTHLAFSESANVTFNPSTTELRGGFVNRQSTGTKQYVADATLVIDASLTQSVAWLASMTATRSLQINNLADGREVFVYIRNTNATQRQITFSSSATTVSHTVVNMSAGAGAASVSTQNIAGSTGTMMVYMANIAGNFVGGIM